MLFKKRNFIVDFFVFFVDLSWKRISFLQVSVKARLKISLILGS